MRILEVASEGRNPRSGIGRMVDLLSDGLQQRGHEVLVKAAASHLGEFKFSTIPLQSFEGFDIIHVHGPTPGFSELTILRNRAWPIIYTHYADVQWLSRALSEIYVEAHRRLANAFTKAIVVWTEEYRQLFHGRTEIIRPPVRPLPSTTHRKRPAQFTVLFVGQFRPFKGIDVFLRAARELPEVQWVVAGAGWMKRRVLRLAEGLPHVRVISPSNDQELADLYANAHVLVVPAINTTEAFSLVALEASLFGCVPIASDLRGVRENIRNLGGIIFPPGYWWDLAAIIDDLRRDPERWNTMSENCKSRVERYAIVNSVDRYVSRHLELFYDVAGKGSD